MKTQRVLTGLAGAAAMAGASQAYGAVVVVTTPSNIVGHAPAATDAGTRLNLDLNGDGQRDLSILYRNLSEAGGPFLLSYIIAGTTAVPGSTVGSYIAGASGNQAYAFALSTGTTVGSSSSFYQAPGFFTHLVTNYAGTDYGFTAYLGQAGVKENVGFKFQTTTGQTDYGYITLETDPYVSAANPGGIRFFKIAYDNTGAAIAITGTAVPEPGTLAALAMGAAACASVGLKRRKAKAAAAQA